MNSNYSLQTFLNIVADTKLPLQAEVLPNTVDMHLRFLMVSTLANHQHNNKPFLDNMHLIRLNMGNNISNLQPMDNILLIPQIPNSINRIMHTVSPHKLRKIHMVNPRKINRVNPHTLPLIPSHRATNLGELFNMFNPSYIYFSSSYSPCFSYLKKLVL